jgi:putative ABC transport system permease protein
MIQNFRHLLKNRNYAIINLFGLTLGLSVSIFIFLFVLDEMSYDKYLPGYDRVIRIQPSVSGGEREQQWATSEGFLVPAISSMYPEIEAGTRILRNDYEIIFKTDSAQFSQDGVVAADSTFFDVFPFEFIHGNKNTALDKPENIVITRTISKKFFGDKDPIGKLLTTDFATLTVTGVVEDVPRNSHFHFNLVFPLKSWWPDVDQSRNMYAFYSYIRLKSADDVDSFSQKVLKNWYRIYGHANEKGESTAQAGTQVTLGAMKLPDIHLQSRAEKEFEPNGQIHIVYIFIVVAVLIMAIAAINYINLSNAMAIKRAKEVAIRKTIGASRGKLFLNFVLESYAFSFLAFVLSAAIVALLIPQFNVFTGKQFGLSVLSDPTFILPVFIGWILLGFLSGLYPATILSSCNPVQALKAGANSGKTNKVSLYLRRGLIISQFSISAFMIVSAFTIQHQLSFIGSRNIGFNKNNVLVVPLTGEAHEKAEALRNEIGRLKSVESCAATSVVPGKRVVILTVRVPDLAGSQPNAQGTDDGSREMRVMGVDHNFVKTLGLQIIDGRDFSSENAADAQEGFLLNEAAVRRFGLQDPVGRPFEYTFGREPKKGKIIGVIKDFNFASVHTPVEPLMVHIHPPFYSTLCIRLKGDDLTASVEDIEAAWKSVAPVPFSYQFLDTTYDAMYKAEKTTSEVITGFTVIALLIACLGLFGIVSFFAAQRIREVGIRKVFGATQPALLKILSYEYVILIVIGNLLALYPAYALTDQWLQQFAYRVDFSFSTFAIAFIASEVCALTSVFYLLLKTAGINPAIILRHE